MSKINSKYIPRYGEVLLHDAQLQDVNGDYGIGGATIIWLNANLEVGDVISVKKGANAQSMTAGTEFAIGANINATLENIQSGIEAAATYFTAEIFDNLEDVGGDTADSDYVMLITERDTSDGDLKVWGNAGFATRAEYIDFSGRVDGYTGNDDDLVAVPSSEPSTTNFGFRRHNDDLENCELHPIRNDAAVWMWITSVEAWQPISTFAALKTGNIEIDEDLDVGGALSCGTTFRPGGTMYVLNDSSIMSHNGSTYWRLYGLNSNDHLTLGLGYNLNRAFVVADGSSVTEKYDHALQTNPTIFVHSSSNPDNSNSEYLGFHHNVSNAVFACGRGGYQFGVDDQPAQGSLTLTGLPTVDDSFVVNVTTITAKVDGSGDLDHFTIGADADGTADNIVTTINEGTESTNVHAYKGDSGVVIIEWLTKGEAGNDIVFTSALTNATVDGEGYLGGTYVGVDADDNLFAISEEGDVTVGGVEVATVPNYGEFYWDENDVSTIIETADTPIMLKNITEGLLEGWTFHAGSTGAITSYQIGSAGAGFTRVNSTGHGLSDGDIISIRGSSVVDYLGVHTVSSKNTDYFDIEITLNGDGGASDWDQGAYLLAGEGSDGVYDLCYHISATVAAADTLLTTTYVNDEGCPKCNCKRKFANNDIGNLVGGALLEIEEGDRVSLTLESDSTTSVLIERGNLNLKQHGGG